MKDYFKIIYHMNDIIYNYFISMGLMLSDRLIMVLGWDFTELFNFFKVEI